jgi:hypothetical protein
MKNKKKDLDLLWTDPNILFDGNQIIGAKPIREAIADRAKLKPKGDSFVDDGKQENFTVAQVASLWELSRDTIQRMFEDEPGVITLGSKNPRGKRKRVTIRIPRAVMNRVKKRRSNPG